MSVPKPDPPVFRRTVKLTYSGGIIDDWMVTAVPLLRHLESAIRTAMKYKYTTITITLRGTR